MPVLKWVCPECGEAVVDGTYHRHTAYGQRSAAYNDGGVFCEIDAKELEKARRDPRLKAFAAQGAAHLKRLREEGRIR